VSYHVAAHFGRVFGKDKSATLRLASVHQPVDCLVDVGGILAVVKIAPLREQGDAGQGRDGHRMLAVVAFPVAVGGLVLRQEFQPLVHGRQVLLGHLVGKGWQMRKPRGQSHKDAREQQKQGFRFHVDDGPGKPQSRQRSCGSFLLRKIYA
jgi:hypothetical protein